MQTIVTVAIGFALGFAVVASTVAAIALAVIAVGGHLLARTDRDYARVISFDPSSVADHAPIPAILALAFGLAFWVIARRLRPPVRATKRRPGW